MENQTSRGTVLAVVDDLFFATKIETVARQVDAMVAFARDEDQLTLLIENEIPGLIIIDLNCRSLVPIEAIRRLKSDVRLAAVPVIGFFSHVQVELERAAREAGCDRILARSAFSSKLPEILRRVDG